MRYGFLCLALASCSVSVMPTSSVDEAVKRPAGPLLTCVPGTSFCDNKNVVQLCNADGQSSTPLLDCKSFPSSPTNPLVCSTAGDYEYVVWPGDAGCRYRNPECVSNLSSAPAAWQHITRYSDANESGSTDVLKVSSCFVDPIGLSTGGTTLPLFVVTFEIFASESDGNPDFLDLQWPLDPTVIVPGQTLTLAQLAAAHPYVTAIDAQEGGIFCGPDDWSGTVTYDNGPPNWSVTVNLSCASSAQSVVGTFSGRD